MPKRKQKQTLKEFKAWLQGVEELQADDWSPSREQWQLIRDKINNIVEEKPQVVEKVVEPPRPAMPSQMQPQMPLQPQLQPGFTPPPPTGGVPPVDVEMTPAAKQMLNPGADGKIKTPDMDTSDGNVSSPFA